MVIKALHLLLLPIAATFGWYFGKRDHLSTSQASHQLRRDYLQGLSYLINEQSDKAVDVFIKLSEVDSDTAEIHLALGHLFRNRGEVERAIRIHQNLLARPELDSRYHEQALFALGQDFFRAGMLDRAEKIFLELPGLKETLRFLLRIYQQQKEWRKAIALAEKLADATGEDSGRLIAQFYCELAEQEFTQGAIAEAWKYLHQAVSGDPFCVRANLIAGRIAYQTQRYVEAVQHYKQIKHQNIHFIPEIITPLRQCYDALNDEKEPIEYFKECLLMFPNLALALTVTDYVQRQQGDQAAMEFITQHVKNDPALHGLNEVMTLYLNSAETQPAREKLTLLQGIIRQLFAGKSAYRCGHCGFAAPILFWCCPQCYHWGTVGAVIK